MSNVIENRVVEMQFDNSNFEKNVATSMTTLDRLKQSLDFSGTSKSLGGVQKAAKDLNDISFNNIQESLAAIQERFSTMGIIGMTVIQDLTSAALGAIANVGRKFFGMISTGGINRAMNIEKAKFQLEGLGIAYKDVFDEIDYAVTNTSFSLDAAAQAAAQLSSAGLDYEEVIFTHQKDQKEITQMGMALRAVSGVAAQTMSDYGMVARYFQDIANAGEVTGATLTYMTQVLNLPVKQDLAEGLKAIADGSYEATEEVKKNAQALVKGTEVSVADIEEMCKKGYINFDTFSTIMFNKYADHAVEANRTVSGVMDNIRSAFAKIGAEFVTPIVQIDGAVVHMLDSFRAKVNEFKGYIIPFAKLTTDSINRVATFIGTSFDKTNLKWVEPFFTGLGKVIEGVTSSLFAIKQAFENVFPKKFPEKLQEISENFKRFGTIFDNRRSSISGLEEIYKAFHSFFNLLKSFGNVLKIFTEPFKSFIDAFFNSGTTVEFTLDSIITSMDKMAEMLNTSEKLKSITETMSKIGHTLGQTFRSIVDGIVISIQSLKQGGLKGLVDSVLNNIIRELGDGIIYLAEILTGKDLSEAFTSFNHGVDKMREFFSKFIDACSSGILGIKDFISQLKENLGKFHIDTSGISEFFDGIVEEMSPLDKILQFTTNIFQSFLDFLGSIVPGIINIGKGLVKGFVSIIKGIFKALNSENLSEGLNQALGATFLYNLKNVFIQIRKLLNSFGITKGTGPLGAFNNFMQQLQDTFLQFERSFNGSYWVSVAGAILMLAFAMSILAGIDSDKLAEATSVIVALMAEIGIITKKLSVTDGKLNFADGASGLIAMAIAVSILAGAMKKIASIEDPNQLIASLISIEILIGTLYAVAKSLSTVGKDKMQMLKGASGLIAMSIAVRILASAMSEIAEIPLEKLAGALGSVMVLIALMAEFVKFTQSKDIATGKFYDKTKISTYSNNMISIGLGLMALAGAIKILASAAKDFAELDKDGSWENLGKAGAAITVLLAELAAFTKITGNTKNMISIGIGIVAISAAMKIFASAAKDFSGMNWEELGKAGTAIFGLVAAVALLTKLTSLNGNVTGFFTDSGGFVKSMQSQNLIQIGVGLIAFATAIKIFTSALEDFSYLDWGSLGKAGATITILLVELAAFSHVTDGSNLIKLSGSLVIFSAALLILAPALKALGSLKLGGLIVSLVEVAGILFILATAATITKDMNSAMLKLAGTLFVFGLALSAVGAGLILLSTGATSAALALPAIITLIKETIVAAIQAINGCVPLIVETVFKIINEILDSLEEYAPSIVDSFINIFIKILDILTARVPELVGHIQLFVKAIVDALGIEIGKIDPLSFITAAAGISAFIIILAGAAKIAQKNLPGILALGLILGEVALIFLLLSGIDTDTTLAIAEGLSVTMLALSASMFIISKIPVAAAAEGIAGLAVVVAGIAAILAVLGGLKQIPGFTWLMEEGTVVLSQIGKAIGEFFGSIVGGFAEGMANSLPSIGNSLSEFMDNATPFFEGLKLIDDQILESALKLTGVILAITAADVINGLTSWITGGSSFRDFGRELADFAPYFADFYNEIRYIKPDVVEASANAALALAKMANAVPKEGGVIQAFTGEGSLTEFAKQLVPFGEAMVDYSYSVKDLDTSVVEKSVAAGEALAGLANNLPNSGGFLSLLAGDNTMDAFGEQLVTFGRKLADYSYYVDGLDVTVVEKSVAAGKAIAELANNLPNTGGFLSALAGDNTMDTFGAQLVTFGRKLSDYAYYVTDLDVSVVEKSAAAGKAMVELANTLPSTGGLTDFLFGGTDLQTFGQQLVSFGESMTNFSTSVAGVSLSNIKDLTTGCGEMVNLANMLQGIDTQVLKDFGKDAASFADSLGEQGSTGVQEFADAFTDSYVVINPAITSFITTITTEITGHISEIRTKGEELVNEFAQAMKDKTYSVRTAAGAVCEEVVRVFSTKIYANRFYQYGVYVVEGFAAGMESGLDRVKKAADAMVAEAERATTAKAKIESPSKLFKYYGQFIPQGFALGITNNLDYVSSASEDMIDSAYEAMSDAIKSVYSIVDQDLDFNPVITPVIDLSNVRENVGVVNDLFNRSIGAGRISADSIVRSRNNTTSQLGNLQNGEYVGSGNIVFNQINNSPKALSRIDIYRDTRNLFAQARGALS